MPVPVPMSATLAVAESGGMLGWMRKPSVLVMKMCCSSSLSWIVSVDVLTAWSGKLAFPGSLR